MKRILVGLALVAIVGAGIIAWRVRPRRAIFYTDADTIRAPAETALTRDILWRPPARLPDSVNTLADDYEPVLSPDGLALYFVRGKAGEGANIYFSVRSHEGWSEPRPLEAVSSEYDELGPELSADGRSLYFYSDRPGGMGGYDLWVAQLGEEGWLAASNLGARINSEYNDYGPAISPDGRALFFASNRPQAQETNEPGEDAWPATLREDLYQHDYDLYVSSITDRGVGTARSLALLNSPHNEGAPSISPVGDFIYFSSDRPGGEGAFDLYRSRRFGSRYEAPRNLGPGVNTQANELDPALSMEGYALHFSSDRVMGAREAESASDYDVYVTTSREVFREVETYRARIDWSGLWGRVGPHLLWALLVLLLLALLLVLWREAQERRFGLLARCLLGSVFVHLLLVLLFNFWAVTAGLADAVRRGGVRVSLASPALAEGIAAQLRGELTEVESPASVQIEIEPARLKTDVRLAEAGVTLAVERKVLEMDSEPIAEAVTADAPEPAFHAPVPDREVVRAEVSAPMKLSLPEMSAPAETIVVEAEPVVAASEGVGAVIRRHAVVPTTQPVDRSEAVLLAPPRSDKRIALDAPLSGMEYSDLGDSSPGAAGPLDGIAGVSNVPRRARMDVSLPPAPAEGETQGDEEAPRVVWEKTISERRRAVDEPAELSSPQVELNVVRSTPSAEADNVSMVAVVALEARDAGVVVQARGFGAGAQVVDVAPVLSGLFLPALEEPAITVREDGVARPESAMAPVPGLRFEGMLPDVVHGSGDRFDALLPERSMVREAEQPTLADVALVARDLPERRWRIPDLLLSSRHSLVPDAPLGLRLPSEMSAPRNRYVQRSEEARAGLIERMGGSDETERAVALGLAWLARHQSEDGRWDADGFDDRCGECGGETDIEADNALTGLALLCFLGADHRHTKSGPYRETVERGLGWLLDQQRADGSLMGEETMYSHGIASIALSEAYGMTGDDRLARPVRDAAGFIWRGRNRGRGGWRYEPGQAGDTSVTGWQIMALKSASLGGIPVPGEAFEMAGRWLDRVSRPSARGLYAYQPGGRATPAMTAEGMFVQQLRGLVRDEPRMGESAALIQEHLPDWDSELNTYYWYYGTLAMFQHQGPEWRRWNESLSPQLVSHQHKTGGLSGSWDPEGKWATIGGRVYQTALCTLMLEVYYRYLPLYSVSEPIEAIGKIEGVVRADAGGGALEGATVMLEVPDRRPIRAITDAEGRYELPVPEVPDHFAISASREGYVPESKDVARESVRGSALTVDFSLEPDSKEVIAIEAVPEVHHLGNDMFEGRINSQFQKKAEGRLFAGEFALSAAQLSRFTDDAEVRMLTKGVQCPHPILINGRQLEERMGRSPDDGSFGIFSLTFDPALLEVGDNRVEIRASSCRGDVDDFEFVNLQIRMAR